MVKPGLKDPAGWNGGIKRLVGLGLMGYFHKFTNIGAQEFTTWGPKTSAQPSLNIRHALFDAAPFFRRFEK